MPPVLLLDPAHAPALRAFLARAGFHFEMRPHMIYLATRPGVNVAFYASGKVLLTGKQADEYALVLRQTSGLPFPRDEAPPTTPKPAARAAPFRRRIGMDESGKGDYFGPLVAASVLLPDETTERFLKEKGVRDSKLVPDDTAMLLASLVRARCPTAVVVLPPAKYNELYERIGNLNHLLAWAHARALEDLLGEHPCDVAILDQFAKSPRVMATALMERGRAVTLTEAIGAEADAAVAAASLVARGEFLRSLAELSREAGVPLPKGAGPGVIQAARAYVARHGRAALGQVAKLHFATTERVDTRMP